MLLVTRLSLIVINVNWEGHTVSILGYHIETEHEEPLSMCWNQDHKVTMHKGVQDSCDICDINSSGTVAVRTHRRSQHEECKYQSSICI